MFRRHLMAAGLTFVFTLTTLTQQTTPQNSPSKNPNDPIERIKDEGMNRSQVMQTLSYLTDVIGPRLTGSPGLKRANEWTRDKLSQWGLQNAHLEAWGPFGRGWALKKFSAQVVEPQAIPLIAYPKAWSPGLKGTLTADVVYVDAKDEAGLVKYKGKLKGAIVLTTQPRELKAHFDPLGVRLTEKDLLTLADSQDPFKTPRRRPLFT
ncbi:MAG: peptidase M28, partial [Pyrinomonadaceae bacterium]